MLTKAKILELERCLTEERKLADAARSFETRMRHRRTEQRCMAALRAGKAPGYTEPMSPEKPFVIVEPPN